MKEVLSLLASHGLGAWGEPPPKLLIKGKRQILSDPQALSPLNGEFWVGGSPHSLHKSNAHSGGFPPRPPAEADTLVPVLWNLRSREVTGGCLSFPGIMWTKATDGPEYSGGPDVEIWVPEFDYTVRSPHFLSQLQSTP